MLSNQSQDSTENNTASWRRSCGSSCGILRGGWGGWGLGSNFLSCSVNASGEVEIKPQKCKLVHTRNLISTEGYEKLSLKKS